jgi:alkylation response protein AidB-like acyl-CoA dehydrogenase
VRGLEDAPELRANALVGEARFALGAAGADGLVIACRDTKGPALAAVVRGTPGLRERPVDDQLGLRGAPAAVLSFDHATAIPLGGVDAAARAGALVHAGVAGIARGIARRAHEMAFAYAEERYQGGGPIIIHGAVRDMLARMAERELGVGRAPEPATAVDPAVALAQKAACTDAAVATTTDAVQVFGGMGYMRETGVEKLMRDARYCQLFPASNWATREALLQLQRTRRASSGHGT